MSDDIPNPAYDPEYGKQRRTNASAFAPTLRLEINAKKLREYDARGMTFDDANEELTRLFSRVSVSDGARFTAESITVIETSQVLKNFQSMIDAIFELDDVLHLKLATGDVVAVELYLT